MIYLRGSPLILLLWLVVAVLTGVNAATWFEQRRSGYEAALAGALREAEIANDAFAEETLQMFHQVDIVLRGMRAVFVESGSVAATERYIDALKLGRARIENGYLVDADGRLVITHNPATVGRSVADRDYFRFHQSQTADAPHISSVEIGRATGQYFFRVTRRIDDAQGQFAGVALVTVAPGSIGEFYARLTQNDGSVATLLSTRDKRLRARTPEPPTEAWARVIETPLWQELARAPVGRFSAVGAIDGVQRHHVYRAIPEWDMVMLTGVRDALIRQLFLAGVVTYVDRQRKRLKQLASTDSLTGLPNRRALLNKGERELTRAQRYSRPLSLLLIDVDRFKQVNDRYGHASGDRVLQALAAAGQAALRDCDTFGRFGGEEFLALLPETDDVGAATLAERLRGAASRCAQGLDDHGQPIAFTVSIGIAVRMDDKEPLASMISRADAALYSAKSKGRDRAEMAPAGSPAPSANAPAPA
jgi:diguanylate cyclase (GGDEF)-like protein